MSFFREASIKAGITDLVSYMHEQKGSRLLLLLLACIPTSTIIWMFYIDARDKAKPPPPTVTYIESWPADRSVEQSLAANLEYQKRKDAMREREREAYKALGRAVGMDVDTLDAQSRKAEVERRAKADADIAERLNKNANGASK